MIRSDGWCFDHESERVELVTCMVHVFHVPACMIYGDTCKERVEDMKKLG